jgi:hypothetical protein
MELSDWGMSPVCGGGWRAVDGRSLAVLDEARTAKQYGLPKKYMKPGQRSK